MEVGYCYLVRICHTLAGDLPAAASPSASPSGRVVRLSEIYGTFGPSVIRVNPQRRNRSRRPFLFMPLVPAHAFCGAAYCNSKRPDDCNGRNPHSEGLLCSGPVPCLFATFNRMNTN
jgi:hypothetical protein